MVIGFESVENLLGATNMIIIIGRERVPRVDLGFFFLRLQHSFEFENAIAGEL